MAPSAQPLYQKEGHCRRQYLFPRIQANGINMNRFESIRIDSDRWCRSKESKESKRFYGHWPWLHPVFSGADCLHVCRLILRISRSTLFILGFAEPGPVAQWPSGPVSIEHFGVFWSYARWTPWVLRHLPLRQMNFTDLYNLVSRFKPVGWGHVW